jgi:uncharacterized protein
MTVVSDTTAISALLKLGQLDLLPALFGDIVISEKVLTELSALTQFSINIEPILSAKWLKIKASTPSELLLQLLSVLDVGEAYSIALSIELSADRLIIDERKGRLIAEQLDVNCIGLGGVLVLAKDEGLIDTVKPILDRLQGEVGFYMSHQFRDSVLKLANETP